MGERRVKVEVRVINVSTAEAPDDRRPVGVVKLGPSVQCWAYVNGFLACHPAAGEAPSRFGKWMLTHIPTGMGLQGPYSPYSPRDLLHIVGSLGQRADLFDFSLPDFMNREQQTAIARRAGAAITEALCVALPNEVRRLNTAMEGGA